MISIHTVNISKSFGRKQALKDITLSFEEPGIYGIVGSNGSGKTTLLKIITNLCLQSSGSLNVYDENRPMKTEEYLKETGVVVGSPRFRRGVRGIDLLRLTAEVKGIDVDGTDIRRAIDLVDAGSFVGGHISDYSKGMLQRILLANGLIGMPRIMILDEPTSGLDPETKASLHSVIRDMDNGERIIIFTSHDLWEVESLCTKATVLESGLVRSNWLSMNDRKYIYITLRHGTDVDKTNNARIKYNSGKTVLVTDIEHQHELTEYYSDDIDSIQRGSELPAMYLTDSMKGSGVVSNKTDISRI